MATSQATANLNLDADYGSGTPAYIYACLTTSAPNESGSGTIVEPTQVQYPGYASVNILNDVAHWPAAANGQKTNGIVFVFPVAGPAAVANTPLTHIVFRTGPSGRIIDALPLPAGTVIMPNQAQYFAPGAITINEG